MTPMCGIETLIGCASYIWNEACETINRRVSRPRNDRVEYVIVKAGFVNKAKVRATLEASVDKEYGDIPWLGEDLFQAKVLDRTCPADQTSCAGVPWQVGLFSVGPSARVSGNWSAAMYGLFREAAWFVD